MIKLINFIQNSKVIESIHKSNNRTNQSHALIVLFGLYYYFTKDSKAILFWSFFEIVYTFAVATSIAKDNVSSLSASIFVGILTTTILALRNTEFMIVYAVIITLFLSGVYKLLLKLNINMKQLPQALSTTFTSVLQQSLLVVLSYLIYRYLAINTGFVYIAITWIFNGLSHILGIILTIVLISTFWSKGFHGASLTNKLFRVIYMQMLTSNMSAYISTGQAIYLGGETFYQWAVFVGGSGATLGLAFAMRFFAKDEELQIIGKSALKSSIFNINEEIIFGVPVVENSIYKIPFYLAPILSASLVYFCITQNILRFPLLPVSWILPGPIGLFLSSLMDPKALIIGVLIILITFIVYLPFLLLDDQNRRQKTIKNTMS